MKKHITRSLLILLLLPGVLYSQPARMLPRVTPSGKGKVDTRIDNIGYWMRMVQMGYVKPNPPGAPLPARFDGTGFLDPLSGFVTGDALRVTGDSSRVTRHPSRMINSPDIPVTNRDDVTQSENSVFIDPGDENVALNSNNSSNWILGYAEQPYGADALYSLDAGESWGGSVAGVNGNNAGDPATAIGLNGWWYVGRITGDYGQAVSYSKDQGKSWTRVKVGLGPATGYGLLDKNHLAIDNSPASPFQGYLYTAWTNFIPGDPDTNEVEIVRSANQGLTWSSPYNISAGVNAGKLCHGVNLQTGPNGELYAAWSIYDTWPSDETAIGFTKSVDGGGIFQPATRIISNIKGIRASMTGKNMRVNSFPSMAVDNSYGPHRGTLYLVWANAGVPGINTGTGIDIYLVKSIDEGTTWSAPVRVNQDPPGMGKQHFFPWITCDAVTGGLSVVYYDDRFAGPAEMATFVSVSYDGGNSWSDFQVSDYTFTPEPIPGLAFSYFGDYIGIQSQNMKVYPMWTDNHDNGRAMTYVSPFDLGPNPGQPWVMYHSDSLASVTGGGNANLNFGDSLYLTLGLKNTGDQPAADVTARISTLSPYILLTDSIESYGAFAAGETRKAVNGYSFRVSDTIPDNLMVRFDVKASNPDSAWYSHFSLKSHAPAPRVNGLTILDTISGNRNGRLDAGETARLRISVANTGDFPCYDLYALIACASPYLTLITDSVFLGTLPPKQATTVVFTAVTDPGTPVSTGTEIMVTLHSGRYHSEKTFHVVIGQVAEDWETGNFLRYPWQQGGSKPWEITAFDPYEGIYSARSGPVGDYQNSQLLLSYEAAAADSISFYFRTSTEQDYDFLMFSIDNVLQQQWSGETPWTRASFAVSAGMHTFKWIYLKDLAVTNGADRVWIDLIGLPPPVLPETDPGTDDTVCAGDIVFLQASAQRYDSLRWQSSGDGSFGSDTSLVTTYIPGTGDILSGNATLRLTAYGTYGSTAGSKQLRILPRPVAGITAIPGDTACAGNTILLTADTTGVTSWLWMPGHHTGPEVVFDTAMTHGLGTFPVMLMTTNTFGCQNRDSVYITFKNCTSLDDISTNEKYLYPNPNTGRFFLRTDNLRPATALLTVTDEKGAAVFNCRIRTGSPGKGEELDLTFLPEGVYLLSLKADGYSMVHKLVIRR